jgi:AraC family transcriptional regulator
MLRQHLLMTAHLTFESDLLTITSHNGCGCRRGHHEGGTARKVTMVRRGVYTCEGGGECLVVDGLTAVVYDGHSDYCIDYPTDEAPHTTHIDPGAELMDEAFPTDRFHTLVGPETAMKHHRLFARARDPHADRLEVEEAALDLLADLSERIGQRSVCGPAGLKVRRRLDHVRGLMMAAPEVSHPLAALAREAGCSPFHFARLFKQETGCSVRGYRQRLRLAVAMDMITQGANDLTAVALDAGFAHHSHMTSAFRALLGRTPSEVRRVLAAA